ncbi:MAG: hypothetical protein ABIJ34_06530 [archaeon]|nr:hypothetical protein [Candidatus Micrarchaeota archaeon]MBU1166111.1 hypothetical protein [Candidatus Micrarchaeota archaeon]MBU1887034.1 hypothetical protein [Candidatus Micrarchaeota archaeon]
MRQKPQCRQTEKDQRTHTTLERCNGFSRWTILLSSAFVLSSCGMIESTSQPPQSSSTATGTISRYNQNCDLKLASICWN